MNPLPGEQTLVQAGSLTVTTHRVRQEKTSWGAAQTVGIMLEEVSSCALLYRSYYVWLILAVASVAGGIGTINRFTSTPVAIGFIVAMVFVGVFFLTRRQVLLISPAGGLSIAYVIGGADRTQVLQIIDTIEAAKDARAAILRGQVAPSASMPTFSALQPMSPPVAAPPIPSATRNCRVCGKPIANPASKFCQACGSPQ